MDENHAVGISIYQNLRWVWQDWFGCEQLSSEAAELKSEGFLEGWNRHVNQKLFKYQHIIEQINASEIKVPTKKQSLNYNNIIV